MDWKEYFMTVLWPLLTDEQKERLARIAEDLSKFAPKDDNKDDSDD